MAEEYHRYGLIFTSNYAPGAQKDFKEIIDNLQVNFNDLKRARSILEKILPATDDTEELQRNLMLKEGYKYLSHLAMGMTDELEEMVEHYKDKFGEEEIEHHCDLGHCDFKNNLEIINACEYHTNSVHCPYNYF